MKIYLIAFKILTLIYNICLYFLDYFIILSYHSQKAENKILIIRLDAIGDFILWLDSAQYFKRIYSDKKIILLANQAWADLAKKLPFWDEVWELDRPKFERNLTYRFQLLKKVRKAGFDVVIQPAYSREFIYGDAIVRISGAREKIGSVGDYSNIRPIEKKISDQFYTRLIPANPQPLMELKRNAEFMRGLGLTDFKADLPELPSDKGISYPSIPENYYVICPGAMLGEKMWPIEKFAWLAGKIYEQAGLTGVVCGGHGEEKIGQRLETMCHAPLINMIGKTTLNQMLFILKNAYFLIGNDSCAVHIAVAVSTPSVCILGGGHFGRFMPYDIGVRTNRPLPRVVAHKMDCFGCNWECIYSNKKNKPALCIYNISVEEVFAALQPLIKKRH